MQQPVAACAWPAVTGSLFLSSILLNASAFTLLIIVANHSVLPDLGKLPPFVEILPMAAMAWLGIKITEWGNSPNEVFIRRDFNEVSQDD